MRRQGRGGVVTPYNNIFFFWWRRQIIALDDYPYERIDFSGDPNMLHPPGASYDAIGKQYFFIYFIFCIFVFKRTKIFFGWCF
jgi:hypothetical protein